MEYFFYSWYMDPYGEYPKKKQTGMKLDIMSWFFYETERDPHCRHIAHLHFFPHSKMWKKNFLQFFL